MSKAKANNLKVSDIEPFEHLEDVVRNTTPYQRYQWLAQTWDLWYNVRRTLPKRIVELQDKFSEGKI